MTFRRLKFSFFLLLSLVTCLAMYLVLAGEPLIIEGVRWEHPNLYRLLRYLDENPLIVIALLGVVAIAEAVTALMYLTTPPEHRMIRYKQGDDEVLVNLDTLAGTLQGIIESEHDVESVKVMLRVPPGKQLRIKCFIRLTLLEQPDIPRRVEQLKERVKTHFEQALPLEAKFTTSVELKIVPASKGGRAGGEEEEKAYSAGFEGPRFPVEK